MILDDDSSSSDDETVNGLLWEYPELFRGNNGEDVYDFIEKIETAFDLNRSVATLLRISVQCPEIGHLSPGTSGKYPDLSGKYQKCLIIGLRS